MSKTKAKTESGAPTGKKAVVQKALEVIWVLKGHLKNAQIAYLRVGALLMPTAVQPRQAASGRSSPRRRGSSLQGALLTWIPACAGMTGEAAGSRS